MLGGPEVYWRLMSTKFKGKEAGLRRKDFKKQCGSDSLNQPNEERQAG